VVNWEKIFWFLKFLIPKLIIIDPTSDALDELLNSVDLSTYGLERVKLNAGIGLDDAEIELDPQNPNPRGAHGTGTDEDPLDLIINSFNERWYQGWDATPEDQRVKFVSLAKNMQTHPDFKNKYAENSDSQNREIAFVKIFNDVISNHRKTELDLYKKLTQDDAFRIAMQDTLKRMLSV